LRRKKRKIGKTDGRKELIEASGSMKLRQKNWGLSDVQRAVALAQNGLQGWDMRSQISRVASNPALVPAQKHAKPPAWGCICSACKTSAQ
jgi:hypothetical protein